MRYTTLLFLMVALFTLICCGCGSNGNDSLVVKTTSSVLAAGTAHSVFLKSDGTIWVWGENTKGQLGDGSNENQITPIRNAGYSGSVAAAAGSDFTVILKSDGTVWGCGDNSYGQLGDGTNITSNIPVQVQIMTTDNILAKLTGVTAVSAGDGYALALRNDGTVWAWGYNIHGQLGDGTIINRNTAAQVAGLSGVVAIAAGSSDTIALRKDGTVCGWGANSNGELGYELVNGQVFSLPHFVPVQVAGLSNVTAIAEGDRSTYALIKNGTVWALGANWNGQLGDGTTNDSNIPVQVSGISGVTAIAAGFRSNLALMGDGTVRAWGANWYGQIGDGTIADQPTPVKVADLSGVVALAAGKGFSIALKNDGSVWAWGYNDSGQLGDGTTTISSIPVRVGAN